MARAVRCRLSVNLNKVALVRNARGGDRPSVADAAELVISAGCDGLTVHPREDERHATLRDVAELAALPPVRDGRVELNVEGDLRPDLMHAVREARAAQFTAVPVTAGERTTTRGWRNSDGREPLLHAVEFFGSATRVSVFVDPEEEGIRLAADVGAAAVEFHTRRYAETFGTAEGAEVLAELSRMADLARGLGLRVHAGHDLDLANLPALVTRIWPDEVSIGHALVSEAIMFGLPIITRRYLECVAPPPRGSRGGAWLIDTSCST